MNLHDRPAPPALGEDGLAQLLLPLPGIHEHPPTTLTIPRADRVFANRNLRMGTIDWVGFDMDYTMAIYRQAAMDALSINLMAERLVKRGYPEFLRELTFDTEFPIRGLVVDTKFGNILKMDRHKLVSKGYHGTKALSREDTERLYLHRKVKAHTQRYHWIDTLFALCEVTAYAALVTALEERSVKFDPRQLFLDVRASIDEAHADGSVYRTVTADLDRYIEQDPELPKTLHKLRSSGKRLFLLTNSPYHYTDTVMSHLLDHKDGQYPKWRQYFDVVICAAKKPTWFAEGTEFKQRTSGQERTLPASQVHEGPFEKGKVYEGGGLRDFERRLGIVGSRVLYVGDHIYGDILRSKKDSTWRTAMIIQELDREVDALEKTALTRVRRRQLYEAHPLLEDELRYFAAQLKAAYRADPPREQQIGEAKDGLEMRREQLAGLEVEYDAVEREIDQAFHPYFGSLLKELNGLSIFGQQVDLYADVYMRRVSCLGEYSPTQFFRSPHDLMPHEI